MSQQPVASLLRRVSTIDIYETRDYTRFVSDKRQRAIVTSHVDAIANDMKLNGFIDSKAVKVAVNQHGKFDISDGQHRIKAAEKAGVAVKYFLTLGSPVLEMVRDNELQKSWQNYDYLHYHKEDGKFAYVAIDRIVCDFKLPITFVLELLYPHKQERKYYTSKLRDGTLSLTPHEYQARRLSFQNIQDIRGCHPSFESFNKSLTFLRACKTVCTHPAYSHDQMMVHLRDRGCWEKIKPCRTQDQYVQQLAAAYNLGKGKASRINFSERVIGRYTLPTF